MTDLEALHRAVLDTPDDDTPRLIYADALEIEGDADYAAFIRADVEFARMDTPRCRRSLRYDGKPPRQETPRMRRNSSAPPLKFKRSNYYATPSFSVGPTPEPVDLDEIRDRQKRAIRSTCRRSWTVQQMAEAIDEPVITVRLRLAEMGWPIHDDRPKKGPGRPHKEIA